MEHVAIWAKDVLNNIDPGEPVSLYCCATSKRRMPCYERLALGDIVYLKQSGGSFRWRGVVTHNRVRKKKLAPLFAEYHDLDELEKLLRAGWHSLGPDKDYDYWKQTEKRKRRGAVVAFTLGNVRRWDHPAPRNRERQMWYVLDTREKTRKWCTWR